MKKIMMMLVVGVVLIGIDDVWGADYSFGEWAGDAGLPVDATFADARSSNITNLDGLTSYTSLQDLYLSYNPITGLHTGHFAGLNKLRELLLNGTEISSIETGTFSGMQTLYRLDLYENLPITTLNLNGAQFRDLTFFNISSTPIDVVDLTNAELSQLAFDGITDGGGGVRRGIASPGIIEIDFDGANLSNVEQLNRLYAAIDLQELNLANVAFADTIVNDNYDEVVQLVVALERETLNVLTIDMDVYTSHQSYFNDWDSVAFNELTVVPEPCTLFLIGLGGLFLRKRRP